MLTTKKRNKGKVQLQIYLINSIDCRKNRELIKTIADILRLTATQNIAQRGHRETDAEDDKGNFIDENEETKLAYIHGQ